MKKKLFRLALLVTFVCALLIAGASADAIELEQPIDGDGTAADPYQIASAAELYWFAQYVNAGHYDACAALVDKITVNEQVLTESGELVSDTDSLHRWTAICNVNGSYTGTFSGNGQTISGLYCVGSHAEYIGLFGRVGEGGVVKDVIIEDSYIEGVNSAGGVCNQNSGEMYSCRFSGIVKTSSTGAPSVGGVCAVNHGSGQMIQCDSSAAVISRGNYGRAGGVCGNNSGTISYCYNTGSVTNNDGDDNLGGVCGQNSGTIENCYNEGNVSGDHYNGTADGSTAGGVCGKNSGTITNCYNTGNVSYSLSTGGVCGNSWGSITNCYNTGNVDGGGRGGTGGVCGTNGGTITNCYNTGSVSGLSDAHVGGVCGENSGTITNCYNTGTETYSGDYYNHNHGGGVCGSNSRGTVINCYWLDTAYDIAFSEGSGDATKKTAEQFASGEVTWLLNGESTDGPWRQNLGVAELPSLHPYQNVVVKEGDSYINSNLSIGNGAGDGPANVNGTYLIADADDLYWFAEQVNSGDKDANAVLMADIDLGGSENPWTPIGLSEAGYIGTFDGQGYTIRGLYYESNGSYSLNAVGLFGTVDEGGRVQNVKVEGEITNVSTGATGGGICGNNNGTIENCSFSGSISGSSNYVGGVCGENSGTITNCSSSSVTGSSNVGGVCGENSGTITNCFNTGSVSGLSDAHVGGVCGTNSGTITNCYWLEGTASAGIGNGSGTATNVEAKTAKQFASGEVTWLLNGESTDGPWRQDLGTDEYPVLDGTRSEVLRIYIEDVARYINPGSFSLPAPGSGKAYFDKDYNYIDPAACEFTDGMHIYLMDALAVRFVYGDGTSVTKIAAEDIGSVVLPAAPSKPGCIFMGWRSGDMTYQPGDEVGLYGDTTFTAVWANMPDITPSEPDEGLPFTDVPVDAWYYDAVKQVYEAGLMNGVSERSFAPNGTLTRAMLVTVLWRMEGAPASPGRAAFVDVQDGSWYAKAVAWAAAEGIVEGRGAGVFDPEAAVTRQETAAILYRLAVSKGCDVGVTGSLTGYADYAEVGDWAARAMLWATVTGLIEGDGGALRPAASCTRAEAAALLMRFCGTIL